MVFDMLSALLSFVFARAGSWTNVTQQEELGNGYLFALNASMLTLVILPFNSSEMKS